MFFVTASVVLSACVQIKAGIPVKQQGKEKLQANVYCYNCAKKGHHGYVSISIYFLSLKCLKQFFLCIIGNIIELYLLSKITFLFLGQID